MCRGGLLTLGAVAARAAGCAHSFRGKATTAAPWFSAGLTFKCTECGRCCRGRGMGEVRPNDTEKQEIAHHLGIGVDELEERHIQRGTGHLLKGPDGSCVFLAGGQCSIWPVRPTPCATYPFWSSHLASRVDWRAAASACEGITQAPEPVLRAPGTGCETIETQQTGINLEAFSEPHAGHPDALPVVQQEQIVKAAMMKDIHDSQDIDAGYEGLAALLSEAVDEPQLEAAAAEFAEEARTVIHRRGRLEVVDTCVDGVWQRDVIHLGCPGHTQSSVGLRVEADGSRTPDFSMPPSGTTVFLTLAASVSVLQELRSRHSQPQHDAAVMGTHAGPEGAVQEAGTRLDGSGWPTRVLIVGAGACSVPRLMLRRYMHVEVHAVDIDECMLEVAREFFGAADVSGLHMVCAEGKSYLEGCDSMYDLILLDVAVPVPETHGVCSPPPEFLETSFLRGVLSTNLVDNGCMVIHCLGPPAHRLHAKTQLSRFGHVIQTEVEEHDILYLVPKAHRVSS